MSKGRKEPIVDIDDELHEVKMVVGRLRVLYRAALHGDTGHFELTGFQDIVRDTLKEDIDRMDKLIDTISKDCGLEEVQP